MNGDLNHMVTTVVIHMEGGEQIKIPFKDLICAPGFEGHFIFAGRVFDIFATPSFKYKSPATSLT